MEEGPMLSENVLVLLLCSGDTLDTRIIVARCSACQG